MPAPTMPPEGCAALYLRSSKDRSDVSTDAQRRTLNEHAATRALTVVAEYVDEVESGKDTDRPGFRQMLAAVQNPHRGWDTLLILDTSRLSRRRSISLLFEEQEAKPRGIRILYKNIPDTDEITEMLLKSILTAMDEWHSLTSRQKGLAGMSENVRQGYRAGGRAPTGYRLKTVRYGTNTRDGNPVTKTLLEPDPASETATRQYLQLRLDGTPRRLAIQQSGLPIAETSAVHLEWSALTYAGCTVWNVHSDRAGQRRRPRAEWQIQPDTHPAYITREQAEQLITRLEQNNTRGTAVSHAKRRAAEVATSPTAHALLVGRLISPDGRRWEYDSRKHYRLRRLADLLPAAIEQPQLDAECIEQIVTDLTTPETLTRVLASLTADTQNDTIDRLARQHQHLATRISRLIAFASTLDDPTPAREQINTLSAQQRQTQADIEAARAAARTQTPPRALTPTQIRAVINTLKTEILDPNTRPHLYPLARTLIEEVVLCPVTGTAQILYRVPARGNGASPRGFDTSPYRNEPGNRWGATICHRQQQ